MCVQLPLSGLYLGFCWSPNGLHALASLRPFHRVFRIRLINERTTKTPIFHPLCVRPPTALLKVSSYITTKSGTAVSTEAQKKSATQLAKDVIAGKWGNGSDRKNRLTQAGYDYAAVQAKVNELMK